MTDAEKAVDILLDAEAPQANDAPLGQDVDVRDLFKDGDDFFMFMDKEDKGSETIYRWRRRWQDVGHASIAIFERPGNDFTYYIHLLYDTFGQYTGHNPVLHTYTSADASKVSRTIKWLIDTLNEKMRPRRNEEVSSVAALRSARWAFDQVHAALSLGGPSPADPPPSNEVSIPRQGGPNA